MQLLLGEILDRNRQAHPDKTAITLGDEALTFAQVDDAANRYANALAQVGVRHRDVVVWWSDMSLRTVEGFMALARLGAAFAPINARFGIEEAAAGGGVPPPQRAGRRPATRRDGRRGLPQAGRHPGGLRRGRGDRPRPRPRRPRRGQLGHLRRRPRP